jgi:hypothetical protein
MSAGYCSNQYPKEGHSSPHERGTVTLNPVDATMQAIAVPRMLVSLEEAEKMVRDFAAFKRRIILSSKDNHQTIKRYNKKSGQYDEHQYITKSGWRLVSAVFGISLEVLGKYKEAYNGEPSKFVWRVKVRASIAGSRYVDAEGACSSVEKRFLSEKYDAGRLEHDMVATAETRAKNRATSDIVGAGEMSAEEETMEPGNYFPPQHGGPPALTSPHKSSVASAFVRHGCQHCDRDFVALNELVSHTVRFHPGKPTYPSRKVHVSVPDARNAGHVEQGA